MGIYATNLVKMVGKRDFVLFGGGLDWEVGFFRDPLFLMMMVAVAGFAFVLTIFLGRTDIIIDLIAFVGSLVICDI